MRSSRSARTVRPANVRVQVQGLLGGGVDEGVGRLLHAVVAEGKTIGINARRRFSTTRPAGPAEVAEQHFPRRTVDDGQGIQEKVLPMQAASAGPPG